jgi:hypothetical protein
MKRLLVVGGTITAGIVVLRWIDILLDYFEVTIEQTQTDQTGERNA